MGGQMILRIDPNLKEKFRRCALREGKTMTEKTLEMIEAYLRERDLSSTVNQVWKTIGEDLRRRGYRRKDVKRKIGEVRKEKGKDEPPSRP